uniref:Serine/threonine-protein kinase HT1 n=1 Tax=Rhizophora mucronata TaxID=61149 RepID=A0A2P2LPF7_RHIMU
MIETQDGMNLIQNIIAEAWKELFLFYPERDREIRGFSLNLKRMEKTCPFSVSWEKDKQSEALKYFRQDRI